eukprot:14639599-Ditylum_brightwellii.AAC.1
MNKGEEEDGSNKGDGINQESEAMLNWPLAKEQKGGAYLVGLSQFNLETLKDEISDEDVWTHLKWPRFAFTCHVTFNFKDIHCNITESSQSIWKNLSCPNGVIIEDH